MEGYNQYQDVEFCRKYLGCCGTCITREETKNICLATEGEYTDMVTANDFTCENYFPCRTANLLLEQRNELED